MGPPEQNLGQELGCREFTWEVGLSGGRKGAECGVKVSALGEEVPLSKDLPAWPVLGVGSWGVYVQVPPWEMNSPALSGCTPHPASLLRAGVMGSP